MSVRFSQADRHMWLRRAETHAALLDGSIPRRDLDRIVPFRPKRLKRYQDLLARKAEVLLARGTVQIITNAGEMTVDLLTFEDGSQVLEFYSSPGKIDMGAQNLTGHDVNAALLLGLLNGALRGRRVRPVAEQEV